MEDAALIVHNASEQGGLPSLAAEQSLCLVKAPLLHPVTEFLLLASALPVALSLMTKRHPSPSPV